MRLGFFLVLFALFAALCFTTVLAVSNVHKGNDMYVPITARNTRPLSAHRVLVDNYQNFRQQAIGASTFGVQELAQMTPLAAITEDPAMLLLSTTKAQSVTDDNFFPFGRVMTLDFDVAPSADGAEETAAFGIQSTGNSFVLEADVNMISTTGEVHTTSSFHGQSAGQERYSKHTSFKGTRLGPNGKEETLVLSVLPRIASGVAQAEQQQEAGKDFETQQVPQQPTAAGYTMEAVLFAEDGKLYHIVSYETLLYEMKHEVQKLETSLAALQSIRPADLTAEQKDDITRDTALLNVLLNNIIILSEQQQEQGGADAMMIRELPQNNFNAFKAAGLDEELVGTAGPCGTHDAHESPAEQQEDNSPLAATPKFTLSTWTASCHTRMDTVTVLTGRYYLSYQYQTWAGGSVERVEAKTKLLIAISNQVMYSQFRVLLQPVSFVHAAVDTPGAYNTPSTCSFNSKMYQLNTLRAADSAAGNVASHTHALVNCMENGIAGMARMPAICNNWSVGASAITSISSWTTFAHEMGHNMNAQHTFDHYPSQALSKSIMGYGDQKLDAKDAPEDIGAIGFSYAMSGKDQICPYLNRVWAGNTLDGSMTLAQCFKTITTAFPDMCTNDGLLQPWQQCQGETACCRNCKFTTSAANCGTAHPECCVNCVKPTQPTLCEEKSGYCSNGECIKFTAKCNAMATSVGCEASRIFNFGDLGKKCQYPCYSAPLSCGGMMTWGTRNTLEVSESCYVDANTIGVCVADSASSSGVTCKAKNDPAVTNQYSWQYVVYQESSCDPVKPLLDQYTCRDGAATVVGDDYCANVPKPPRATEQSCGGGGGDPGSSTITTVSTPASSLSPGDKYTVAWKWNPAGTAAAPTLNIALYNGSTKVTDLATNVPAAAQSREVTIPTNTAAVAQANIVISATGVESGKSGNFAIYTYSWSFSNWSTCSATICGAGTQTRTATCKRNDGANADAALCKTAATTTQACQASGPNCNAATQQGTCSSNKCTCSAGWSGVHCEMSSYTYSWSFSEWSTCSATVCGSGTQTRTATCKRNDGTDAAAALCTAPATTSQACQAAGSNCNAATQQGTCASNKCTCSAGWTGAQCESSSYTYSWSFSDWSACSATVCGAGSQTRTATCKRNDGVNVAATFCTAAATTTQNCQATTANCNAAAQQGTCSLNKCTCNQGWTGAQCGDVVAPKCNTTTCPTTHGKCDAQSDTCVCNEPEKFYGADCKSSYSCDQTQCANGGSIALTAGSCAQQCTCVNQWEDAANVDPTTLSPTNKGCTVCGLDCSQYGSPDAACDKCQCRVTYWSDSCTCRFLDWQHTFLANAGWSPNVTRFTNKAAFLAYSTSADADDAIIAEVNGYFGRILTIYQTITGVHPLRLSIQDWSFSAENLKLSTRFYAPCTGDTTIPGFDAVQDVLMPGYTPIEEIFYHVNTILSSFSQFNAMRVDVAGISSLMSAPNADEQVTVDAGVGDKVITHPSCQEADFPRGEFSCDMADNKSQNNAAFGVSSSMFSVVMVSTLAAVVAALL